MSANIEFILSQLKRMNWFQAVVILIVSTRYLRLYLTVALDLSDFFVSTYTKSDGSKTKKRQ